MRAFGAAADPARTSAPSAVYLHSPLDPKLLSEDARSLRGLIDMFHSLTITENRDLVDWAAVAAVASAGIDIARRVELQAALLRELAARDGR